MRRHLFPCLLVLASAAVHAQTTIGNEKAITPERLRSHLELIASDELEGRDTPSRGLDFATLYVATQLKLWGAKPAGDDGTFYQRIALTQRKLDTAQSTIGMGGKTFSFGDGFRYASRAANTNGALVYAGHGYMIAAKGVDPFKGLDVKGKILVVASGLPAGITQADLIGTPGTDYSWASLSAQKNGAIALITIPDAATLANWNSERSQIIGGIEFGTTPHGGRGIPEIIAGPALTAALFEGEAVSASDAAKGTNAPEKGFSFASGKTINLSIVEKRDVQYARNVVAVVPGSDPKLRSEYVAFGAHIDHVGTDPNLPGDKIYNGADDDGSGTVSILEIAHAFLTGPRPKRSCLFVWHIGEEKGLWGSAYYTDHPTVDLKQVVAQLNIDMIGRSRPPANTDPRNAALSGLDSIYVIGTTMMSSDLQKVSEKTNNSFLKIKYDYRYDDPKDPEQFFFRSDHYNYARKGIPILFYFDGVHEDYHQVGDEVSKIDFRKMSRVAKTVYATGLALANGAKRPVVDKPLKR